MTAIPTPSRPKAVKDLPSYLDGALPPEGQGKTEISDGYVTTYFQIADGLFLNTVARKYARDYIFAAYGTGLPIKGVQIVIMQPNGKLGLSMFLGAHVAATQKAGVWADSSVGPSIFVDWLKRAAIGHSAQLDEDGVAISGEWAQ